MAGGGRGKCPVTAAAAASPAAAAAAAHPVGRSVGGQLFLGGRQIARARGAKTDATDVTHDGIRLIVAFVDDFHILVPGRGTPPRPRPVSRSRPAILLAAPS